MGAICGVSRGKYIKPVLYIESGIKFIDDDYNEIIVSIEEKYPCEHPGHWPLGNGTRNGQKLYYPLKDMYYQKWHLTEEELNEAVEQFDMFSLEMHGRIICKNCAQHEIQILKTVETMNEDIKQQEPKGNGVLKCVSNRVHVISHGNKWAVVKNKAKKATKLYQFREQAYFHARQISDNVVVHNKDATVLFKHGC
jgi:hypothetical protein